MNNNREAKRALRVVYIEFGVRPRAHKTYLADFPRGPSSAHAHDHVSALSSVSRSCGAPTGEGCPRLPAVVRAVAGKEANVEYNLGYRAHYSEHGHHLSYSNGANTKGVEAHKQQSDSQRHNREGHASAQTRMHMRRPGLYTEQRQHKRAKIAQPSAERKRKRLPTLTDTQIGHRCYENMRTIAARSVWTRDAYDS